LRQLIVSGDDFGLHSSINEAIEEAFQKGILTSASIVVNGEAAEEAIRIAKRNPGLGIGLHLTLIEEKPLKISEKLAPYGYLPSNHNQLAFNLLTGKIPLKDAYDELEAQFKYALNSGLNISHVDSHRHMHMLPRIWSSVADLMKKYNIEKIRYVDVPFFDFRRDQIFKNIISLGFKVMRVLRPGYRSPNSFIGFMESGNFSPDKFIQLINKMDHGIWEIGMHPGKSDKVLKAKFPDWDSFYSYQFSWEGEFRTMLDKKVSESLAKFGIELINYNRI